MVVAAAVGGWWALRSPPGPDVEAILPTVGAVTVGTPALSVTVAEPIAVHVAGAVARPGVHELAPGSRVLDAIAAAGGLTDEADGDRLNLAEVISDGARLWVPSDGEGLEPPVVTLAGGAQGSDGATSGAAVVDINTAEVGALEGLPGIGPSLAASIVEHRDRVGPFQRVDDLDNVSGIGPAKLEQLRPHVRV